MHKGYKGQPENKGRWRWGGGGGGVWNFLFADQRIVFLSLPLSNSHCFRHPVRSQRGKVQKVAKNMRWKCSFASCIAGYAPLSVGTVLCTHKRDFATVTLIVRRPKWEKSSKTESCWYRRVNEQFLQKWLRKSKRNLVAKKARTYEWVIMTYGRFLADHRAPRVTKETCTFWS